MDVTGSATADDYKFAIQAFMDDPNVDIIMPWFVFQDDPLRRDNCGCSGRVSEVEKETHSGGGDGRSFYEKIVQR